MIHCVVAADAVDEGEVVAKALQRSFTQAQIEIQVDGWPDPVAVEILVLVGRHTDAARYLRELGGRPLKVIVLGPIDPGTAELAGVDVLPIDAAFAPEAECSPARPHAQSESRALIRYAQEGLGAMSPLRERRLCRYDFADEWNNLGYGAIGLGAGPWSIGAGATPRGAATIAELRSGAQALGAVVTLNDSATASILWCARPVGPVDGADWSIIEAFLSAYRAGDLPCRPYLCEVPDGYAAAVTVRLDCDEDIASARPLFESYRARGIPLSLAVKTEQDCGADGLRLLAELRSAGGSILSHSATHAADWGGSAQSAEAEARQSKAWLEARVPDLNVRYAVSPFHKNPRFVPQALARAGYSGFVAGAIGNDPEYLLARGGAVPHGPPGFVSHSQSCMLHGDCLLAEGDRLAVYKQAFRVAQRGSQFFGYLDHPFSARYSYGWRDEQQRLAVHAEFIDFLHRECAADGRPLAFLSEETCLDFMREKALAEIEPDPRRGSFRVSRTHAAGLPLSVAYRGHIAPATNA
jgi:hypothetical protein